MSAFIVEITPFPYEDRALLVAEDTTILAGEKLNFRSIYSGPSDLYAAQDLNTGLWGIFDEKGEEVLPFEYDEINTNRRRFELKRGEETAFMDGERNILSKEPEEPEILSKLEEKHGSWIYFDSNFLILKNYEDRLLRAFNPEGKLITK